MQVPVNKNVVPIQPTIQPKPQYLLMAAGLMHQAGRLISKDPDAKAANPTQSPIVR